jgi:hypothetical protein
LLVRNMNSPSAGKLACWDTIRLGYLLEQYCAERLMSRATQSPSSLFIVGSVQYGHSRTIA